MMPNKAINRPDQLIQVDGSSVAVRKDELAASAAQLAEDHRASGFAVSKPAANKITWSTNNLPTPLIRYLGRFESALQALVSYFRGAAEGDLTLSYAAEWVLDNHYIATQALREIAQDLPPTFYRQLPKFGAGPLAGYPRVYALARSVAGQEGRAGVILELERVSAFVHAYQSVIPLTMGELWALPLALRLVVVENLILAACRIAGLDEPFPGYPLPAIPSDEKSDAEIVATSFTNLRALAAQDWKDFFEDLNLTERLLRRDPAGLYPGMDFPTRDRYRKVVEELAQAAGINELDVAREVVRLSQHAEDSHPSQAATGSLGDSQDLASPEVAPSSDKKQWLVDVQEGWDRFKTGRALHVGYYLLGAGRPELEHSLGYRPLGRGRLARWVRSHPTWTYLGAISLLAAGIIALAGFYAARSGSPTGVLFACLLTLLPAATLAVHLVNWIATKLVPPRTLPKMDFEEGLPPECASLVVVPALLSSQEEVIELLRQIELHYLRNPDPHLAYALLSDFMDAPAPSLPEDEPLLMAAVDGVRKLNKQYSREGQGPFLLFHRARRWNPAEGRWMGWERKRGKLGELNRLILGQSGEPFLAQEGNLSILPGIRYVITLDADTVLPSGSARRLIAALAHPLNRAEFSPDGRVRSGYTILQPRTEISPVSANQSWFTRLFAGDRGLDLYTLAVSDVYQDLFGEGIYVGKGIYDVRAFERSLVGRVPENALLSHDLFEGIHGRAGLATDIVLVEDYPPHYLVYTSRLHRWVRGDWQLIPWLFPRVPASGSTEAENGQSWLPNHLSPINRWKIADNLRRSLVAPGLLVLLLAGWLWLPGSPVVWTLLALASLGLPAFTQLLETLLGWAGGHALRPALRGVRNSLARWFLAVAFLPYEAAVYLDAILVTLYRLLIAKRGLLRWTTAAHAASWFGEQVKSQVTWRQMATGMLLAASLGLLVGLARPQVLPVALPLIIVWLFSPEIAHLLSRPINQKQVIITTEERLQLRRLARRTWLFLEQFVGPEDQWLPPDHYQESPLGIVAHRTSPTNIGLAMLSTLGAYDLGYLGLLELAARLRATFETLSEMERYRGHFYNWYDTRTLELLNPRYISTVDSGNLAACLVALGQGCQELDNAAILRWDAWEGFLDTLALFDRVFDSLDDEAARRAAADTRAALGEVRQAILAAKGQPDSWPDLVNGLLDRNDSGWNVIEQRLAALVEASAADLGTEGLRQLQIFTSRTRSFLAGLQREMQILLPWIPLIKDPPALFRRADLPARLKQAWEDLAASLDMNPKLGALDELTRTARDRLSELQAGLEEIGVQNPEVPAALAWCEKLAGQLESGGMAAKVVLIGFDAIRRQAEGFVDGMDFAFLFDRERQVFHIGYNATAGQLDNNYYDLLASEARLASLVAISKREVPYAHWLHLSRPFTQVNGSRALLSWSATMFEYLMPELLARSYPGTLLDVSSQAAVDWQIDYASQKQVPWGISESGYYRFDLNQFYQYRAFGVPKLGYKRGLGDDLVIAPYASLLALSRRPSALMKNLAELARLKMFGTYGLYEAVDFTPARQSFGNPYEIVRSYMAHHQGMIFLSLVNYLLDSPIVRRFHADPRIQSVELLLQEQLPQDAPLEQPHAEDNPAIPPALPGITTIPWRVRVQSPQPRAHFLFNGSYGLMITSSGGGYSTWGKLDLTRWQADTSLNNWGQWVYVQDLESGSFWSAGFQPTGVVPQNQDVFFNAHMAEFRRRDQEISLMMEVTVSPEHDVEIRRLTLVNHSDHTRRLRVISYAEVVLAAQMSAARHPAFNKLFIESEFLPGQQALLFHRRPRSVDEAPVFLAHAVVLEGQLPGVTTGLTYETNRANFLGRGRTTRYPQALRPPKGETGLTNMVGATLDPILALGQEVNLSPHGRVELAFLTVAASARREALDLVSRYRSWSSIGRAFDQARSLAEAELRQLGLQTIDLERIQTLLSLLIYPSLALRAEAQVLAANRKGQPGLWAYGISGDYPILLARLAAVEELPLAQELLQAHMYWRKRGLEIDLVFLNTKGTGYDQELIDAIHRLLVRMDSESWLNRRGGIFLVTADQMADGDRVLLESAARVVLDGEAGSIADQIQSCEALWRLPARLPSFLGVIAPDQVEPGPPVARPAGLLFENGLGGFSADGREYVIYLEPGQWTPAPWVNVIANPEFGTLVSEAGLGYSWAVNSGENRLSPWSNDPVSDPPGEAIYLRDEETTEIWSPTPLPARAPAPYLVRHGAGYTVFEHHSHSLKQRLEVFIAPDDPVKIMRLHLENSSPQVRRITATYYIEWVLGVLRETGQAYLIPDFDPESQALLARNPYNPEFGERVAFIAASKDLHGLTTDRLEFLGRMGSRARPAGLRRVGLSSAVQPGADPCGALVLHVDLQPGESQEVFFLLGQGTDREAALRLACKYREADQVEAAWQGARQFWDDFLSTVSVETPEPAMNLLLNRWLLYQTLSCRIWGRSAFYQSSGAYGFRDQLQDVLAMLLASPDLARQHLLRAARHQFEAGDVLHWWHPPSGRGVRTRFSDDLLWLPYVTAGYVQASGDDQVLQEKIPFLRAPPLDPKEDDRYGSYPETAESYSLWEHCRRAVEKGTTFGPHNLPLMGSGDWNDGMNRVGVEGHGESIWLAWFLIETLQRFASLCDKRGDLELAAWYRQQAADLKGTLEKVAWDGDWYLRAFYDDGTPLGSFQNRECQIDSIAQSWAVLSGAGDDERSARAMDSVSERLVRWDDRLILLFTPPFDKTSRDPGYVKGYLPGTRENGGQYTHAALWTVWAFTRLGKGDLAEALFRLLNPIYHADEAGKIEQYRVEPYVVAADIYSIPPHTGRGGWTWYTGSSGWMYRLGLEAILGLRRDGKSLVVDPCIPAGWPGYRLHYRHGSTEYEIQVENPNRVSRGVKEVHLDGQVLADGKIPLSTDGRKHLVKVVLG